MFPYRIMETVDTPVNTQVKRTTSKVVLMPMECDCKYNKSILTNRFTFKGYECIMYDFVFKLADDKYIKQKPKFIIDGVNKIPYDDAYAKAQRMDVIFFLLKSSKYTVNLNQWTADAVLNKLIKDNLKKFFPPEYANNNLFSNNQTIQFVTPTGHKALYIPGAGRNQLEDIFDKNIIMQSVGLLQGLYNLVNVSEVVPIVQSEWGNWTNVNSIMLKGEGYISDSFWFKDESGVLAPFAEGRGYPEKVVQPLYQIPFYGSEYIGSYEDNVNAVTIPPEGLMCLLDITNKTTKDFLFKSTSIFGTYNYVSNPLIGVI